MTVETQCTKSHASPVTYTAKYCHVRPFTRY